MLYCEFLEGIGKSENDWTLKEYERINRLYMDDDSMTKAEAYNLYTEPDQFIKDLLDDKATYKAEMVSARAKARAEHEENLSLKIELDKATRKAAELEAQLFRIKQSAHNLYYSTGVI